MSISTYANSVGNHLSSGFSAICSWGPAGLLGAAGIKYGFPISKAVESTYEKLGYFTGGLSNQARLECYAIPIFGSLLLGSAIYKVASAFLYPKQ